MSDDNQAHQIQGFGGFDLSKVTQAVGSLAGAGDEVGTAVAFVRDHGDEVVHLLSRLPQLLASAAEALTGASDDVAGAARFLVGGGDAGPGVKSVAGLASEALDACREELANARGMLDAVANAFSRLPIPDGGIGQHFGDTAQRFDSVGSRLAEVAEQLRSLGHFVDQAGHGLAATAEKLRSGGTALSQFSN